MFQSRKPVATTATTHAAISRMRLRDSAPPSASVSVSTSSSAARPAPVKMVMMPPVTNVRPCAA
jgi:hypothetical protein